MKGRSLAKATAIIVVVSMVCVFTLYPKYLAWDRRQMINTTLKWGRLAPFPTSAKDLKITTEGSAFTRAFRVTFHAPSADIEHWLQESPGTKNPLPAENPEESTSRTQRRISIRPEGAQVAEIVVDFTSNYVQVYVAWS